MVEDKRQNTHLERDSGASALELHHPSGGAAPGRLATATPANYSKAVASLHHWHAEAARAAEAFERRWTMRALKRVNPDLAQRLQEQVDLFHQMKVLGDAAEIDEHGAATCRGWQAAVRAMEEAGEPDDAYVIGFDPNTGIRVAIGDRICAAKRVAEVHGDKVVWLTPDEVATLFASVENLKTIQAIKQNFPGAEVIQIYGAAS